MTMPERLEIFRKPGALGFIFHHRIIRKCRPWHPWCLTKTHTQPQSAKSLNETSFLSFLRYEHRTTMTKLKDLAHCLTWRKQSRNCGKHPNQACICYKEHTRFDGRSANYLQAVKSLPADKAVNYYNEDAEELEDRVNLNLSLDQFQSLYTR